MISYFCHFKYLISNYLVFEFWGHLYQLFSADLRKSHSWRKWGNTLVWWKAPKGSQKLNFRSFVKEGFTETLCLIGNNYRYFPKPYKLVTYNIRYIKQFNLQPFLIYLARWGLVGCLQLLRELAGAVARCEFHKKRRKKKIREVKGQRIKTNKKRWVIYLCYL